MATFIIPQASVGFAGNYFDNMGDLYQAWWSAKINGDYIYNGNTRSFRITSINLSVTIAVKPQYRDSSYLGWNFEGMPGWTTVHVCSCTGGSTTVYDSYKLIVEQNLGYGYEDAINIKGPYSKSLSWTLYPNKNNTINLYNGGGRLRMWLRFWGRYYATDIEMGMIYSSTYYPSWDPNNPGVQYCTRVDGNGKATWETHKIKRYNGSSWQDVPGKRYNGGSWQDVKG